MSIRRLLMSQANPPIEVEGLVPLSIEVNSSKQANDYKIYGNTPQIIDREVVGVGVKQADGTYKIPVNANGEIKNIYLNSPLLLGDYTQFDGQKVHREWRVIDLGDILPSQIAYIASYNGFQISFAAFPGIKARASFICVTFVKGSGIYMDNNHCFVGNASAVFRYDDANKDKDTFLQKNKGVLFFYELATSSEEHFTIPSLELAEGTNIIDVDTTIKPEKISVKARGIKKISV